MIDMLSGHGADIVKFAGDAVIAVWQVSRIKSPQHPLHNPYQQPLNTLYTLLSTTPRPALHALCNPPKPALHTLYTSPKQSLNTLCTLLCTPPKPALHTPKPALHTPHPPTPPCTHQVNRATRSAADTAALATAVCLEMNAALDQYVCQDLPPGCTLR